MKLFYATDVHGSEICWKKFISGGKFYEVDTLILGGDMTGKAIVPIIAQGNDKYKVTLLEQESILEGDEAVQEMAISLLIIVAGLLAKGLFSLLTRGIERRSQAWTKR